jgi:hypothetical protein
LPTKGYQGRGRQTEQVHITVSVSLHRCGNKSGVCIVRRHTERSAHKMACESAVKPSPMCGVAAAAAFTMSGSAAQTCRCLLRNRGLHFFQKQGSSGGMICRQRDMLSPPHTRLGFGCPLNSEAHRTRRGKVPDSSTAVCADGDTWPLPQGEGRAPVDEACHSQSARGTFGVKIWIAIKEARAGERRLAKARTCGWLRLRCT